MDLNSNNPTVAAGDYDVSTGPQTTKAQRWAVLALGDYDGDTLTLQHGDGTTFATFKDGSGQACVLSESGGFEVVTGFPVIRITRAGGGTNPITITVEPIA